MAASSSDGFTQVGNPGSATTLAAPGHAIAGTSITVGSTSNWPTATGVIFAIDTVTLINGVEVRDVGSYTEWEGVVSSGTTVTSMVLRYGTDQNYPTGSTTRVYIPVASSRENRTVNTLLVSLDQDGSLKAGAVDNTAVLGSDVVTTAKILNDAVTAPKIDFSTFDSFVTASSNLTASQTLTASGSGTIATSTNSPTLTLAPGSYLLLADASTKVVTAGQDSSFGVEIYNLTTSAQVATRDIPNVGTAITAYLKRSVMAIVTPTVSTQYTGRATQSFGSGSTYSQVDSSLVAIPLLTTDI